MTPCWYTSSAAFLFYDCWKSKVRMKNMGHRRNRKHWKKFGISIWKHDIGFLNFLRFITFRILTTFKNFVIITLPNLGLRKMCDVRFQTLVSLSHFWATCSCFYKLWVSSFNSPLILNKLGLIFGLNLLVLRNKSVLQNYRYFFKNFKKKSGYLGLRINSHLQRQTIYCFTKFLEINL